MDELLSSMAIIVYSNPCISQKATENAKVEQAYFLKDGKTQAFGFGLSFDPLRGGHEFYRPIKERGEAKPMPSQISFILFCSAENFSEI